MTEPAPPLIWGLTIEGIGQEGADASNAQQQILFATPAVRGYESLISQSNVTDYAAWDVLDLGSLGNPSKRLELFQSERRWSSISFELAGQDRVSTKFMVRQQIADGVVETDFSKNDSTIDTDVSGLENTVIYVNDETIKLGSETATAQTYNIDTAGAFGSTASSHDAGSKIFTSVPFWENRRCQLVRIEHPGGPDLDDSGTVAASLSEQTPWRGRLDDQPMQNRGRLVLRTREQFSALSDVVGGIERRKPEQIDVKVYKSKKSNQQGFTDARAIIQSIDDDYTPSIVKSGATSTLNDHRTGGLQIVDQVVAADNTSDTLKLNGVDTSFAVVGGARARFDQKWEDLEFNERGARSEARLSEDDEIYEVMLFDRLSGPNLVSPLLAIGSVSGRDTELFSFHILSLYAAVHLSNPRTSADGQSFDVLQPEWALDVRQEFQSTIVDDLKQLIRATPWATIDRLIWGWNGETVELRSRLLDLIRGYGFKEGVDNDGKTFIFQEGTLDRADVDTARANTITPQPHAEGAWDQQAGTSKTTDRIEVEFGTTPVTDGQSAEYTARDATERSVRAGKLSTTADLTLDLSTVAPSRADQIREHIVARLLIQHFQVLRFSARFDDFQVGAHDYGLGEICQLDDPPLEPAWLVDDEGNRVTATAADPQWAGRTTRNKLHITDERAGTAFTLRIAFLPVAGRNRAPSGIIRAINETTDGGGSNITVFDIEGESGAASSFGDSQADAIRFTVGDETEIFNQDATQPARSEVHEVTDTSEANQTVTVSGHYATNPQVGDVLALAFVDTDDSGSGYENDGLNGTFTNTDRAYVALAQDDETVGDAEQTADEYGA